MKRYDGVIFDLDGTLLNTLQDLTNAVNVVMEQYHLTTKTREQVRQFVGNGIRKLMERCIPYGIQNPRYEEIYETFHHYYSTHCQEYTAPYPGIMELLQELKTNHIAMGIVSNKNEEAVMALRDYYFQNEIEVAIGQNDRLLPKPAPDTVFMALEKLRLLPQNVLYVGDSDVDADTAFCAGVDVVLVSWGFRDKELLQKKNPMEIIDVPDALKKYFF